MPSLDTSKRGKAYWRSLDDLAKTPQFQQLVAKEFPNYGHDSITESTRRQFLKLMGASLALAGLTSCRWPEEKIAPFARRPDGRKPGIPQFFATARELDGVGAGLVVTSYDGRPVKIEGNELHPSSLGAADFHAQASLLELYDPDRSRFPVHREGGQTIAKTWEDFDAFAAAHFKSLRERKGRGLAILAEATASPSVARLRARMNAALPDARCVEYEPFSRDNERRGTAIVFGPPLRPQLELRKAKVIVCLDADPLMSHPDALRYARHFSQRRKPDAEGGMNRLYVFEPSFTVTGSMADHRYPVAASAIPAVAAALAAAIVKESKSETPAPLDALGDLNRFTPEAAGLPDLPAIARDLLDHRGGSLILVGPRQPAQIHALAALLNRALGNEGQTLQYTTDTDPERPFHVQAIRSLVDAIQSGSVSTLLILGGNPVFNAPADLQFDQALDHVDVTLHLSLYDDETSRRCAWHVPRSHALESWGDTRAWDGTYTVIQPLIAPLYNGRAPAQLLHALAAETNASDYDITRDTFKSLHGEPALDTRWKQALHDGILEDSADAPLSTPPLDPAPVARYMQTLESTPPALSPDNLELLFTRDLKLHDGRYANSGWLQELPDPITKLTWDNAACIAPKTALSMGCEQGDLVEITLEGRSAQLPVFLMPGQAPHSITIPAGYGRDAAGHVGDNVGFNIYPLRASEAMDIARGARIRPLGRAWLLATTQDHHAIDELGLEERAQRSVTLVRSVDIHEFEKHPAESVEHLATHYPNDTQLFASPPLEGRRWAMAIDLTLCIGCSACVAACQAENNTPIVGKEQVLKNREMHWIRVDRYFQGGADAPKTVHNPLMCVHCENAPCEQVCPVAATVHSAEGLNVMVYNRCIGTRYCSNNCPYKVRRFNYFNYHKHVPDTQKMMFNPEVTIRSRGVMEKCTYCLQRIEAAKIQAKNERRPIRDGEIRTACQQTCPTQAIVFGDLADRKSEVARLHNNPRAYLMLGELLVKPRTLYLARLRNPKPEIDAHTPEQETAHHA